jgi:hypothetical protein
MTVVPPVTPGTVAARLADDRGRFAGDRRFVDGGNTFDDLAVAGDHLSRLHDAIARFQFCDETSSIAPALFLR